MVKTVKEDLINVEDIVFFNTIKSKSKGIVEMNPTNRRKIVKSMMCCFKLYIEEEDPSAKGFLLLLFNTANQILTDYVGRYILTPFGIFYKYREKHLKQLRRKGLCALDVLRRGLYDDYNEVFGDYFFEAIKLFK